MVRLCALQGDASLRAAAPAARGAGSLRFAARFAEGTKRQTDRACTHRRPVRAKCKTRSR